MQKSFSATIGALALLFIWASAQSALPEGRTVRVILPVPPGGAIDIFSRIVAEQISTADGVNMIVESKPGAGGIIAAEYVAHAPPDGSVLLSNNNAIIVSSLLHKVNYDPITSFEPVCYLVTTPQIVVVSSASPYHTLSDLLDAARAKPGELSIASVGPNTTQHIGIERLKRLAKADLTYVPYPGGATPANALLGNHITAAVLNWSEIGQQITSGSVRPLATMAAQHIEPLPNLPTVAESGFPGFETDVWFGVAAPAGTPKDVVSQLIEWFRTAVLLPPVKAKLGELALYPNPKCGDDFAAHIRRQYQIYSQAIHDVGIKAE